MDEKQKKTKADLGRIFQTHPKEQNKVWGIQVGNAKWVLFCCFQVSAQPSYLKQRSRRCTHKCALIIGFFCSTPAYPKRYPLWCTKSPVSPRLVLMGNFCGTIHGKLDSCKQQIQNRSFTWWRSKFLKKNRNFWSGLCEIRKVFFAVVFLFIFESVVLCADSSIQG